MDAHPVQISATPPRRKARLARRLLIFLGLLLMVIGGGVFVEINARSSGEPAAGTLVSQVAVTTLEMKATWQGHMLLDQSSSVTIALFPTSAQMESPTVTPGNQTAVASNPTPVGTPGVPIEDAYGPGYHAFAIVQLEAPAFDVSPNEPQTQSLEQPTVQFIWTLLPKDTGPQVINVLINVQWQPIAEGETIERPIGGNQIQTQVDATPPPPTSPSLDPGVIVGLIVGIIGALATITGAALSLLPWYIDRQAKRKRSRATKRAAPERAAKAAPDTQA